MATLSVQDTDRQGVSEDANLQSAASGGDQCPNDGQTVIVVDNGDTSGHDVQFDAILQEFGQDVDPPAVTVPAGERYIFGAFDKDKFGSTLSWTYPTGVTSVQVAAVRIGAVQPK